MENKIIRILNSKKRFRSLVKYMGWKNCLFSKLTIDTYWGGRIIVIGNALVALEIDWRKNWVVDMITGKIE